MRHFSLIANGRQVSSLALAVLPGTVECSRMFANRWIAVSFVAVIIVLGPTNVWAPEMLENLMTLGIVNLA